jgi:isoleucyl-tRNA synthetase
VHLADWPDASAVPADPELVAAMDRVRDVSSAGHAIRKAERLRVRLPLAGITVAGPGAAALEPFRNLIQDELNVKSVTLTDDVSSAGELVLTVNPRVAGPRIGGAVQAVLQAAKGGSWTRDGETVVVGGVALEHGEYDLRLTPADGATSRALPGDDAVVVLDTTLTPELEDEGLARDVVRMVQEARRSNRLDVRDRIALSLTLPTDQSFKAVSRHKDQIAGEVLATSVEVAQGAADGPDLPGHGRVGITLAIA